MFMFLNNKSAQPRNGPACQRCREKRAAARDAAENENPQLEVSAPVKVVEKNKATDKSEEDTLANLDSSKKSESKSEVAVQVAKEKVPVPVIDEVDDEFSSNETYETKPKPSCSCGAAAVPERKLSGFDFF